MQLGYAQAGFVVYVAAGGNEQAALLAVGEHEGEGLTGGTGDAAHHFGVVVLIYTHHFQAIGEVVALAGVVTEGELAHQAHGIAAALGRYRAESDFFSPHLFCLGGATPAGHTFARHFGTPPDVSEDPVTGSATGGMAAYLWHHGYIDSPDFIAEQGHDMGRAGAVQVRVQGLREAIDSVQIGGTGVVVLEGGLRGDL